MNLKENKKFLFAAMLFLGIVTLLIYSPSINGDFVYDDHNYITDNYLVKNLSIDSFTKIWSSFVFGNYNPLTISSLSVDYFLFTDNTIGYHTVNIILHFLTCFLVFIFSYRLTESFWGSVLASFLFAVHPIHVESVSWIAGRKDVLYAFFFLLSIIFYSRFNNSKARPDITLTYIFFILSCLSKSMAVILPMVLILIDFYQFKKIGRKNIIEKIPFLVISIVFGIIALFGQQTTGSIRIQEQYSVLDKILLSFYAIYFYIEKLFLPINLSANYPFPSKVNGMFPLMIYSSVLIVGVLTGIVIYVRKCIKGILFAFLFFIVSVIPVLQIVAVGNAITADRFAYITTLPFVLIVAFIFKAVFSGQSKFYKYKNYIVGIVFVWGFWLAYTTYARSYVWQNAFSLFGDMIEKNPRTAFAYNNLGLAYLEEKKDYDKAIENFLKAIKLKPNYSMAYNNLGNAFSEKGELTSARISYFEASLKDTTNVQALNNLGLLEYKLNDFEKAESRFKIVLRRYPKYFDALNNYGNLLSAKGEYNKAMNMFDRAMGLMPNHPNTYINIAGLYFEQGKLEKTKKFLKKAKTIDHDNKDVDRYLDLINNAEEENLTSQSENDDLSGLVVKANDLMSQDKFTEAIQLFEQALEGDPYNVQVMINIAISYAGMENYPDAINYFKQAAKIQPDNPDIYKNIAVVYHKTGNNKMLVESYKKAAKLGDVTAQEWLQANGLKW